MSITATLAPAAPEMNSTNRAAFRILLIGVFFGVTTLAVIAIGYLLNFLAPLLAGTPR